MNRYALAKLLYEISRKLDFNSNFFILKFSRISKDRRNFLNNLPKSWLPQALSVMSQSKAQLFQDILAAGINNFKKSGYFVEFGATDGVSLSNTYLLETILEWRGILAEPAKNWREQLLLNRKCSITTKCVWRKSNEFLDFTEANEGELSSLTEFTQNDMHAQKRQNKKTYTVKTITLMDLLKSHDAPNSIDYLSIDTEGSEFAILQNFNFNEYRFNLITVEHNYTEQRDNIFDLLIAAGYVRIFEEISYYDDWYIPKSKFLSMKDQTQVFTTTKLN